MSVTNELQLLSREDMASIERVRPVLLQNMKTSLPLLVELTSQGVITKNEEEDIIDISSSREKTYKLLSILMKGTERKFRQFLDVIRKHDQEAIAKLIEGK